MEQKQAGKGQTMNFSPYQPTPSTPDDNPYLLRPQATSRDGPASGKNMSPWLTPLTNQKLQNLESIEVFPVALTIH